MACAFQRGGESPRQREVADRSASIVCVRASIAAADPLSSDSSASVHARGIDVTCSSGADSRFWSTVLTVSELQAPSCREVVWMAFAAPDRELRPEHQSIGAVHTEAYTDAAVGRPLR
jgi:hypothetical protein